MAMRSQVWEWDIAQGTGATITTGAIKSITPLSGLTTFVNKVRITNSGSGYSTGITTTSVSTGSGNGVLTINITAVDHLGVILDAFCYADNPGASYAHGDTGTIDGGVGGTYIIPDPILTPPDNGLISNGYGWDFSAGDYTAIGGDGNATLTVSLYGNPTGEINGTPTISSGGTGYSVGDIVYIQPGGTYNLPASYTVTEITITSDTTDNSYQLGTPFSVFVEKGNKLKNKPMTKENQFIVVEAFGCTPTSFFPGIKGGASSWDLENYRGSKIRNSLGGPRAYLQFYVNTTGYFKDPDGVPRDGIPGNFAPYPLNKSTHNQ